MDTASGLNMGTDIRDRVIEESRMSEEQDMYRVDRFLYVALLGGAVLGAGERILAGEWSSMHAFADYCITAVMVSVLLYSVTHSTQVRSVVRPLIIVLANTFGLLLTLISRPGNEYSTLIYLVVVPIVTTLYHQHHERTYVLQWFSVVLIVLALTVPNPLPIYTLPNAFRMRYAVAVVTEQTFMHMYQLLMRNANVRLKRALLNQVHAMKGKDLYVATMSHEIRTPLFGVVGMVDLLAATPLTREQKQYVGTIQSSAETLLSLINLVLDHSRLERGLTPDDLDTSPTAVRDVVDHVLEVLSSRAAEKHLVLAMDVATDVPCLIRCDRPRLLQILLNLLSNAIKFTSDGRVTVSVSLDAGGALRFAVTDTGAGIPARKREGLFDPFRQGRPAGPASGGGGVGLGLTISKQTVELMGGEIGLASRTAEESDGEATGTTLWFTLPLPDADGGERGSLAGSSSSSSSSSPPVPPQWLYGRRCGVAIPDSLQQSGVVHMLQHWGCESDAVTTAASAREISRALLRQQTAGEPLDVLVLSTRLWAQQASVDVQAAMSAVLSRSGSALTVLVDATPSSGEGEWPVDAVIPEPITFRKLLAILGERFGVRAESRVADMSPAGGGALDGLRVLVAEDSPVNQKLVAQWLRRMRCHCTVVDTGRAAVEALAREPVDIVLMDGHMPEMDGFAATRAIRAGAHQPNVVIIAMTALALSGDRRRCLESGMDDYIAKPMTVEQLEQMLAQWARRAVGGRRAVQ